CEGARVYHGSTGVARRIMAESRRSTSPLDQGGVMFLTRRHALKSGLALGASVMIDRTASAAVVSPGATGTVAKTAPPLLTVGDYERAARGRIDPVAWEYIASGAADEISLRWNVDAYRSLRLMPRQLRDVSKLDTSVSLLGTRLTHPILLAPTASHKL